MFLLNDRMIRENSERDGGLLEIAPLNSGELKPTYYNFRLGRKYTRWNAESDNWEVGDLGLPGNEVLEIQPQEFLIIQSLERFRCSKQTLAVFGQSTRLIRRGLSLRNSPFIDPNFPSKKDPGYLELGLKNELPRVERLNCADVIAKVCFFNVSDTYPIGDIEGRTVKEDLARRASSHPPAAWNVPPYDDHPVEGYKGVVQAGRLRRDT